jgi:hypothetical protein
LLWREDVVGWVNVSGRGDEVMIDAGYVKGKLPAEKAFHRAFEEEIERMLRFLLLD